MFKKCQRNIENALERAENIKAILSNSKHEMTEKDLFNKMPDLNQLNLDEFTNEDLAKDDYSDENMENSTSIAINNNRQKSSGSFTKQEIDVLRRGSYINGIL